MTWGAEEWQAYFGERAGILEFDGGLPRAQAEKRAREDCIERYLSIEPRQSRERAAAVLRHMGIKA